MILKQSLCLDQFATFWSSVAIQGASERDPNPPDPKILKNY